MSTPWSWSGGGGRQVDEVGWSWKVMEMGRGTNKGGKRQERKEGRSYHDSDGQSFLGFANFYRHFITDYSQMTLPLTNLCKKATPWNFGEREMTAFRTLKNTFSTAPVLCHWAPDLQMTVETDAPDHAIAGILSVTTKDNGIRLVAVFDCS